MRLVCSILCAALIGEFGILPDLHAASDETSRCSALLTQDEFVTGLRSQLDLEDAREVFRFVFSQLPDEINVHPTENYYYFRCFLSGKELSGNLGFFPELRARGAVNFAFHEVGTVYDSRSIERAIVLTNAHGVKLTMIATSKYTLTFEGRSVVVNLPQCVLERGRSRRILEEEYVGTTFDESGLRFDLVYNKRRRFLFWVLNENAPVPETFVASGPDLVIGMRTGFAFFEDDENNRKILIGVEAKSVALNNAYDGPFDQLPDGCVDTGQIDLRKYLEASVRGTKGRIDEYGYFLPGHEERVALVSYLHYSHAGELERLLRKYGKRGIDARFYRNITKPRSRMRAPRKWKGPGMTSTRPPRPRAWIKT